jgi:DNA (cytosine-5)-methyltransferase 1
MNELALFAGAGGGILGGKLLGWRTVCAVERDAFAAAILAQRQNDGCLEPFPIWSDVETFDGRPWKGIVDVISGGFPCQDISVAGSGAGIGGNKSGLWKEMARIIGEVEPGIVLVENSPALVARGLGTVLGDLAEMGYDAKWGVVGADSTGAHHKRERIWILAYTNCERRKERDFSSFGSDLGQHSWRDAPQIWPADPGDGISEPKLGRVAHGVANRLDRLRALGNGQVPRVVKLAWNILNDI